MERYHYRSRLTWAPRLDTGPPQPKPVREVFIHWTVTVPTSSYVDDMHKIEDIGGQRFGRFSYSFCYHPPSRSICEGAGYTIGAHTKDHNTRAIAVSIIGSPGHDDFPHLVEDVSAFLRFEMDAGRILRDAPIYGHRDVKATACPGDKAYSLIPAIRAAVTAPEPITPPPTPPEDDDMKPAYTLKAKGPAVGKVRDGQVWVVSADGVEAWLAKSANK